MRLIENWREVTARAHSMWAFYLSAILLILPDLIFFTMRIDTNPRVWWFAALAALIYGIVGRLLDQKSIPEPRDKVQSPWAIGLIAALVVGVVVFTGEKVPEAPEPPQAVTVAPDAMPVPEAAFLAVAVPFVGRWEGRRLTAYQDVVGVWTVCYGETKGVRPGDTYTVEECDAMFSRRLIEYRVGIHGHMIEDTKRNRLPVGRDVAFTSLAYNVGIAGAGRSTAVRRLNAGDVAGACEALTWWNKAGGRVIRGLVNRRTEEHEYCMAGVAV